MGPLAAVMRALLHRSVLLPTSRWKNLWDTIIAILVSYTAIMLPIQLCYDNVPLTMPESFVIFDVFVDVAFIADIIFNFRTGFVDDTRVRPPLLPARSPLPAAPTTPRLARSQK